MTRKQKGFTLIELLIVVAIIGILAAIAIPNMLTALQRSRQKRTMADMRSIATSWEARATDTNSYTVAGLSAGTATTEMTATSLAAKLSPQYMKVMPTSDGWKHPYKFYAGADDYIIQSSGKDTTYDTIASATGGPTTDFDEDIIFSNGTFVKYPEGAQTN